MKDYDDLKDTKSLLARIDERTAWICKALEQQKLWFDDHETRIRDIESTGVKITKEATIQTAGAGSLGGSVVTIVCMKAIELFGFWD